MKLLKSLVSYTYSSFPRWCFVCGKFLDKSHHNLCEKCIHQLPYWPTEMCPICLAECKFCIQSINWSIDNGYALFRYANPVKKWVALYKYYHNFYTGKMLSLFLQLWIEKRNFLEKYDYVFSIPQYRRDIFRKNIDTNLWLLKKNYLLNKKIQYCEKKIYVGKQTEKSFEQRYALRNQDIFLYNTENIQGKSILLFDDICTTGSTFVSFARSLRKYFPKKVDFLCIARNMGE